MGEVLLKLDISSNGFGSEGAKSLAVALDRNAVLTDLNSADNRMAWNAEGERDMTGVIAFASCIKRMGALAKLNMRDNSLASEEGGRVLAGMLTNHKVLTALDLSGNWKGTAMEGEDCSVAFAEEFSAGLNASRLSSLDLGRNSLPLEQMTRIQGICKSKGIALKSA